MSKRKSSQGLFSGIRPASFQIIAVALIVTGVTASAWAWLGPAGKAGLTTPVTKGQAVSGPGRGGVLPAQDRVEAEIITLSPTGFEPAEIRRPAGRVLIAVNNLSGLDETTIRLEGEDGQVLQEVTLDGSQQKWRKAIDFTAGTYALTVVGQPEWRCQIFIY